MTCNSWAELQINTPISSQKTNWWPPDFPRMRPVTSMCPVDPPKTEGNPRHMQRGMLQPGAQTGLQGTERTAGGMGQSLKTQDERDRQAFPWVPTDEDVPCSSTLSMFDNLRWLVGWISGLMGALTTKTQDAWRCLLIVYLMPVPALSLTWCGGQMLWR